jgi:SAM-dependent methyltransferase
MYENYFNTRFSSDIRRRKSWKYLTRYLQRYISDSDTVLELAPGYCFFINEVKAKKKFAIDIEPKVLEYASSEVEARIGNACDLQHFQDGSIDVVFASNFFEHLNWSELDVTISEIKRVLSNHGRLIIMQPNFALSYKTYFDDFTHRTIFTDKSLVDWLLSSDLSITRVTRRFLPMTLKSKMGYLHLLLPIYLRLPVKPKAGQMLVIASKK